MVILWNKQYYNKIEIHKYKNNRYDDVCYYSFFCNITIYLRILFYLATKLWALGRNKCEKCALLKKAKKSIAKKL